MEQLLTISQVAQRTQAHPKTIISWIKDGKIRAIKYGRPWLIDPKDLSRYENSRKTHLLK